MVPAQWIEQIYGVPDGAAAITTVFGGERGARPMRKNKKIGHGIHPRPIGNALLTRGSISFPDRHGISWPGVRFRRIPDLHPIGRV